MNHGPRLGVCSWSLRPDGPADLAAKVRAVGVQAVQLHLDPIRTGAWDERETVGVLRDADLRVLSGMMSMEDEDYTTLASIERTGGVRPDATWPINLAAAAGNAALARRLGLRLVTTHAGFVPDAAGRRERDTMVSRLRELTRVYAAEGVRVAFETGQEPAGSMLDLLAEVNAGLSPGEAAGVNFDPANIILYGNGDPIAAIHRLAPHVRQVHLKDATPSAVRGEWGTETPVGRGAVDWPAFFGVLRTHGLRCGGLLEREQGEHRVEDIRDGAAFVRRLAEFTA